MITEQLVDVSRLQFAATAMYHFLFVPLTLGMTWILVIMETVYVMTGKTIYRDMTQFWGKLFGINFALGVTTGITMEFQFGTNWAYYSHYVGDVFGAPLAIEGLMAFFLESTFIGLFFFAWDRLSRPLHLLVTVLMAVGTNLSALWILIANGWMQNPVGAEFNFVTMRMELTDFSGVLFNPVAQAKFVHTVSAGYVTGSMFVLAISSYYLLKGRDVDFARRSFRIGAAFGFASACSVIVLGDEFGYTVGEAQMTKIAAMEALWDTERAPAGLTVVAGIDSANMRNRWEVKIPYLLGLIGTRSLTGTLPGIRELIAVNHERIVDGARAVKALEALRKNPDNAALKATFEAHKQNLGFGLLLARYANPLETATPDQIDQAARDTVPPVVPMFWAFRFMVGLGFLFFALFTLALLSSVRNRCAADRYIQWWALLFLPMPWIACELGWFVAEFGRQPWTIFGVLPTHLSVSSLTAASVYGSLAGFVGFYTILLVAKLYLMIKFARRGPGSLGLSRYFGEFAHV